MKRLIRKASMNKTASASRDFDHFILGSGDIISFTCRVVNNKPWYQICQQGTYNTSSYYDGDNYERAAEMYQELLLAFKGVRSAEQFSKIKSKYDEEVKSLMEEKRDDDYNFQRLKSDPLFLGVNRNDW